MNWYKIIKISQLYNEVKREDYTGIEDPDKIFESEQYFSIGQNLETMDNGYCWIWINDRLYSKKGGTHNMNFGHLTAGHMDINDFYRGWFDNKQELLSIIIKKEARPPGNYYFNENDIPEELDNALRNKFGYKFKYVVF